MVMNLILSHPEVCTATGEMQNIIRGGALSDNKITRLKKFVNHDLYLRLCNFGQSGLHCQFKASDLSPRIMNEKAMGELDKILFKEKLKAKHVTQNMWATPNRKYSDDEIFDSRLLVKNLNGIVWMSDILATMYSDAIFICLIRNPIALAEGRLRRGQSESRVIKHIHSIYSKIENLCESSNQFKLFRFEDYLSDPELFARRIYSATNLSIEQVDHYRFQEKAFVSKDGHMVQPTEDRRLSWITMDELVARLERNVGANQIKSLPPGVFNKLESEFSHFLKKYYPDEDK